MTGTGAWIMLAMECAKNTPFPSGAIIEYARYTSSPTVASDGRGRVHPAELMSVVSTATGDPQVRPESGDAATYNTELLSDRTFHHAAWSRVAPEAVATVVRQSPETAGSPAVRTESTTNRARPLAESTSSFVGPMGWSMVTGSFQSTGGLSHATKVVANVAARAARSIGRVRVRFSMDAR